jgi:hypothetical protein
MPSNEELLDRRRRNRLLFYILKGYQKSDIVRKVTIDYNCSEETVTGDIEKINEWIISVLSLGDSEMEAFEFLKLEYRILKKVLNKINTDRENSSIILYASKTDSYIWNSEFTLMEKTEFYKKLQTHQKAMTESKIREYILQTLEASINRFKEKNKQKSNTSV